MDATDLDNRLAQLVSEIDELEALFDVPRNPLNQTRLCGICAILACAYLEVLIKDILESYFFAINERYGDHMKSLLAGMNGKIKYSDLHSSYLKHLPDDVKKSFKSVLSQHCKENEMSDKAVTSRHDELVNWRHSHAHSPSPSLTITMTDIRTSIDSSAIVVKSLNGALATMNSGD